MNTYNFQATFTEVATKKYFVQQEKELSMDLVIDRLTDFNSKLAAGTIELQNLIIAPTPVLKKS